MTEFEIFKKCVALGMTKAGAAGCTANILAESGGKPNNVEDRSPMSDEEYTAAVDSGSYDGFCEDRLGYGLFQYTLPSRKEKYLAYFQGHGVSIGDAATQFYFAAKEMREDYAFVWNVLTHTGDPYEAAYVMCMKFERPANTEASSERRGNQAKEIYERCASAGVEKVYYNPQKMIDWGYSQIGYHEKETNDQLEDFTANAGDQNWNKYAAYLDSLPGFYNGKKNIGPYGMWCDIWYDAGMVICYGREAAQYLICQPNNSAGAGCKCSAQYYDAAGRFYRSGPEPGDQIFFGTDWDHVDHTGLVVAVKNGRVYTIEGNTSNMVAERNYPLDGGGIFGYGRPRWGNPEAGEAEAPGEDTNVPATPEEPESPADPAEDAYHYSVQLPLLRKDDESGYVWTIQAILIELGYDCGNKRLFQREKPDGEFGEKTEKAVAAFQREHGLIPDGEVGGDTWKVLLCHK